MLDYFISVIMVVIKIWTYATVLIYTEKSQAIKITWLWVVE